MTISNRCVHCLSRPARAWRGLCKACYHHAATRSLYPAAGRRHEPTMEELEELIAQQMKNLPPWWRAESERAARGEG